MGYHSELMIARNESLQLTGLDKTVCADCAADDALSNLVLENLSAEKCSYCGEESEDGSFLAAPFDLVMNRVYESILKYYADAQDFLRGKGRKSRIKS